MDCFPLAGFEAEFFAHVGFGGVFADKTPAGGFVVFFARVRERFLGRALDFAAAAAPAPRGFVGVAFAGREREYEAGLEVGVGVAKSLLNVEAGDDEMVYRLHDITRTYALEKLSSAGELDVTRARHAERCLALMNQAQDDWELTATQPWIDRYAPLREDIRAALDWGLGDHGVHLLGIRLTVSAMPLWQELSLLREHGLYVGKALARLRQSAAPSQRLHMALQLALGSFSYHTQGGTPQTIDAFTCARRLAEARS